MELVIAETIAQTTHAEAAQQAREDLDQLRKGAIAAGRQRSRKIIKVTAIDESTGSMHHLPTGRFLRDWYVNVYVNTLRANLSLPHEPIDAQQVEDATAIMRRIRPNAEPLSSLHAVGVVRDIAFADAAHVAVQMTERLHSIGDDRAIRHVPDERFDHDQLRVQVTRHWYKRCYDNTVNEAVMATHPLAAITQAEELQVAQVLATCQVRRLIGRDNIPLVSVHGTRLTELDRRLAAGETGLVPALPSEIHASKRFASLEQRVREAWQEMPRDTRNHWLRLAGAAPTSPRASWSGLDDTQRTALVQHYQATYLPDLVDADFKGQLIKDSDVEAARKMFNHPASLIGGQSTSSAEMSESALDTAERDVRVDTRSIATARHR